MTRDKILSDLFTSKDFTNCISKMKPENLQEELKCEVALILCEMDESKLIGLAERKELKFYTVRIILNLIKSNSSPFYKKFRNSNVFHLLDNDENEDYAINILSIADQPYCDKKDRAIEAIENLYWYDREIMKLYAEHGTYRKIEEVTGIPFESIYKTVIKNCKEIKIKIA